MRVDTRKMWDMVVEYLSLEAYSKREDIQVVEGGHLVTIDGVRWEISIVARKVR